MAAEIEFVGVGERLIAGIVEGCVQAGCALVGGETAEMPGMYHGEDYDLAGFCVGVVEKDAIIDGTATRAGDVVLGLPSSHRIGACDHCHWVVPTAQWAPVTLPRCL